MTRHAWVLGCLLASTCVACGSSGNTNVGTTDDGALGDGTGDDTTTPADTSGADTLTDSGAASDTARDTATSPPDSVTPVDSTPVDSAPIDAGPGPTLGGCPMFPTNFIFNTPIDALPVDPHSANYIATIGGSTKAYMDMGSSVDVTKPATYYGIPYNVVHGNALTWSTVTFKDFTSYMGYSPSNTESECATGASHTLATPCAGTTSLLPVPGSPLIEGGVIADSVQDGDDHHLLLVDSDTCQLWESYHTLKSTSGYDSYAIAHWNLNANALRTDGWTSADAAGFPMTPLLAKQAEAASGVIRHALRFTIDSAKIRNSHVWPARHDTSNGTSSTNLPPMGQLFRLKASYVIPASFSPQAKAILQALKTYGMYLADGGSNMFITGEPNAAWDDTVLGMSSQITQVPASQFEAVDLSPIHARAGFSVNSGAVPP